jgi:lysozyme
MRTSPNGFAIIKQFETCRLTAFKPYITDPWTIGWGRTRDVHAGDTCTQEQADRWLIEDVADAEHVVITNVHAPMTQNQFDACVSLEYNTNAFGKQICTLRSMINSGKYTDASIRVQFGLWNKSAGIASNGLTRRRAEEARLFTMQDDTPFSVQI